MFQKNKQSAYSDVVVNAFKSVKAWRSVALVLLGIFIMESFALMWLAGQRTVLLIPQNLASSKSSITLNLGEPFSPDYLTSVAKGDAYPLLNWTPDNIDQQYGAFMARLTPALYDAQRETLLSEVKSHLAEGLTQSFYTTRSLVHGSEVTLSGILVRSMGGREVFRGPVTYIFKYTNAGNGMLQVAGVTQPTTKK
ncbi:TraE/TraK family type IV conjugative transfer system protein [Comamonas thiooxydans]|uniref:TraE/TraK family type IV conjugative transfer system protein n=1 Tax=Comamonas thiooxydans TaxID=363952 RepID=UPI000B419815|nr:TraE/TraK family type IV conjugative transfer system protein [Comamonas thiooxydans]